jgi:hypothetical protein
MHTHTHEKLTVVRHMIGNARHVYMTTSSQPEVWDAGRKTNSGTFKRVSL